MIDWISRDKRVPDDRRRVWVWGIAIPKLFPAVFPIEQQYLGSTRFNIDDRGGSFDIETTRHAFFSMTVTHWAEITGPVVEQPIVPQPKGVR